METIKTTAKLELEVIYADGTRKRVHEGILFEAEGDTLFFHNGTDRLSVLFAAIEGAFEVLDTLDLIRAFEGYVNDKTAKAFADKEEINDGPT